MPLQVVPRARSQILPQVVEQRTAKELTPEVLLSDELVGPLIATPQNQRTRHCETDLDDIMGDPVQPDPPPLLHYSNTQMEGAKRLQEKQQQQLAVQVGLKV